MLSDRHGVSGPCGHGKNLLPRQRRPTDAACHSQVRAPKAGILRHWNRSHHLDHTGIHTQVSWLIPRKLGDETWKPGNRGKPGRDATFSNRRVAAPYRAETILTLPFSGRGLPFAILFLLFLAKVGSLFLLIWAAEILPLV